MSRTNEATRTARTHRKHAKSTSKTARENTRWPPQSTNATEGPGVHRITEIQLGIAIAGFHCCWLRFLAHSPVKIRSLPDGSRRKMGETGRVIDQTVNYSSVFQTEKLSKLQKVLIGRDPLEEEEEEEEEGERLGCWASRRCWWWWRRGEGGGGRCGGWRFCWWWVWELWWRSTRRISVPGRSLWGPTSALSWRVGSGTWCAQGLSLCTRARAVMWRGGGRVDAERSCGGFGFVGARSRGRR
jgi:hypothetical protein